MTCSLHQFKKLAQKGNLVPIVKHCIIDCETPVSAFIKTAENEKSAFLLESVELGEKIGRYSFIGFNPSCIVEKDHNGTIYVNEKGKKKKKSDQIDPLTVIKSIISNYSLVSIPDLPVLSDGFVGYFSYENVAHFESIQLKKRDSLGFPQAVFFLTKELIAFDHVQKKVSIIVLVDTKESSIDSAYKKALLRIQTLEAKLRLPIRFKKKRALPKKKYAIKSNVSRETFKRHIKRIKDYIKAGDVIQVVYSQRFDLGKITNDFDVYRALRTVNPSPYMFYFRHEGMSLVGSSPELLVKNKKNKCEVRPIAGTRKRGKNETEDQRLSQDLLSDEKECAEHLMLVDLGRNDLGRVCRFGSVHVPVYSRIEKYSHVMHMVSEVHGELEKKKDAFDLLRATFPAGTVSGAPKIRAMEIINELEPAERGPYAGCLGYFSFNGDSDMCITIRTIMIKNGHAYLQAGAGIVHDSVPEREYQETINKAKALMQAVEIASSELF